MKTMVAPAKRPGRMRGRVILKNFLKRLQPRFWAASSMAGSILERVARALR